MMRPCEEHKPCKYEKYDYSEDCVCCGIDFDGTDCPYIKPWGKQKYKRDHKPPKEENAMAKYIDADKLKAHYAWWGEDSSERTLFDAIIDVQPAADVRPVVRAAWQSWEQDKPPCKWYSCDYCGFHALSRSNYCPHCGAKMDGGGDK